MAEGNKLLVAQDFPAEEGAGADDDNAEDVVIDVSWLSSMQKKLDSTDGPNSSAFTICRVPASIRECDHAAYNPTIVSIGPFHQGMENLQAMEEHKWRCLHEVLAFGGRRNNLEKFLKKMKQIETQARNCYSENIQMSSKEFVEMMGLDGCFIIFLILRQMSLALSDVLIFGNEWMETVIDIDLLLLENQLPFFVLERLWDLIGQPRDRLRNEALNYYEYFFSYKLELKHPGEHGIHHLLHLLHLSFKPDPPTGKAQTASACGKLSSLRQHIGKTLHFLCPTYLINIYDEYRTPSLQSSPESKQETPKPWNMIPTATELEEAGVRFQLKQARSFFQVRFEQELMEMSRLCIYESTGIFFHNFLAFEQCFPNPEWGNHFTSYCYFIDFLVNTPRDVSILREADIIRSNLGSNDEVALLINKLCKVLVWDHYNNYLTDLFREVNQYTKRRWPKWRGKLVRDYFSNPWAIISLIAGIIILILTFLQTYLSLFAYFIHPKP